MFTAIRSFTSRLKTKRLELKPADTDLSYEELLVNLQENEHGERQLRSRDRFMFLLPELKRLWQSSTPEQVMVAKEELRMAIERYDTADYRTHGTKVVWGNKLILTR